MIYELAHIVKEKFGFIWETLECGNACIFGIMHRKGLKQVPQILSEVSNDTFTIRMTKEGDAQKLAKFFKEQPEENSLGRVDPVSETFVINEELNSIVKDLDNVISEWKDNDESVNGDLSSIDVDDILKD